MMQYSENVKSVPLFKNEKMDPEKTKTFSSFSPQDE